MRKRVRNEPWPRPHDVRRIDGTRYMVTQISFRDDDWGRVLDLSYVEEGPYLAANRIPQPPLPPWWRRTVAWLKRTGGPTE